ncbi:hypothetical protein DIS24_g11531 [Lasiodiplodia hormozganensis]|uniref:Uncharacterized protein n=1 Tax=Lasiodiplodia hormozganensis TaxID=869390 RepID=A0AA40BYP1_9PEZI|nr:hypothetical protein DIS24_g11531 [Lasiodiplodia hormozganensis]
MITHHSRAATASARRRLRPASPQATLTRISTAAVRIALLFTLPFTLLALLFIRLSNALPRFQPRRVLRLRRRNTTPRQQTVLLTSNRASNPLALSLARTLHGTGTRVAVAHSSSSSPPALPPSRFASLLSSILPPPTSFSAAVASSLRLRIPARRQRQEDENADDHDDSASLYEHEVLGAILRVRPSVWVPCELLVDADDAADGVVNGGEDAAVVREAVGLLRETLRREAERERPRVRCGVLAPEGPVAGVVAVEQDDGVFRRLVEGLDCGVEVVGGRDVVVRRRGEVHGLLHAGRRERRRWELVEPEGGEVVQLPVDDDYECLDETYERLARLDISDARPWVMREVIEGEAYRIHAIVLNGVVRAFAVSTLDDPHELMQAATGRLFLAPSSPLHASIQAFVNAFVAALPGRPSLPLAIDLTVRTEPTATGTATRIHPTRCSWNLLPLTTTPPFSTAAAELVASVSPPPPLPQRSPPRQQPVDTVDDEPVPAAAPPLPPRPPSPPPTTTDPAAAPQPTKQPIPPAAADLQTPPNSPVLNPLVTRFVASTLPPTPPSSPDSRRSRSVDAAADNASSSSSPPRSSLRRSKRDVAQAAAQTPAAAAAVRSRCYACSSSHRRRASSDESGSESSVVRGSDSDVGSRKAGGGGGRAKVRFEELPPPVAAAAPPMASSSAPPASSLEADAEAAAAAAEPQPQSQPQPQQSQQVRGDDVEPSKAPAAEKRVVVGRGSSSGTDVSADVVPGVAGTYSLPRTLWAYVLLPLLEVLFSLRPRRGIVAVAQGAAVLVERVLLPGAWVEEGWRWWDAGPWLWEWGVRSQRNANVPEQEQQQQQQGGPSTEVDEAVAAVKSNKGKGKRGKAHQLTGAERKRQKEAKGQVESQVEAEVEGEDEEEESEGEISWSLSLTLILKRCVVSFYSVFQDWNLYSLTT